MLLGLRTMTKEYTALRQMHMVLVFKRELAMLLDEVAIVQMLETTHTWRPPTDMVPDRRMEAFKPTWTQSNLQELFEPKCRERATYSHGLNLHLQD
jgi:hypothetical protein